MDRVTGLHARRRFRSRCVCAMVLLQGGFDLPRPLTRHVPRFHVVRQSMSVRKRHFAQLHARRSQCIVGIGGKQGQHGHQEPLVAFRLEISEIREVTRVIHHDPHYRH